MADMSYFLKPGGWKITRRDEVCGKILPTGGTVLIGRAESGKGCSLAWVDGGNCLRLVTLAEPSGKQLTWKGLLRHETGDYGITVKKGKKGIEGTVEMSRGKNMSGTWGAEANPGGGGNQPSPSDPPRQRKGKEKTTPKPNGGGVALQ
jgi:hypothetical protein